MKAIRIHERGGPEALVYEDAPIPALQPGDALVRVHAASISPAEFTWHIWETPDGRSRLPSIPSHEVSGVVAAVAPDVRDVAVGDAVYGLTDFFRDGGAAEYVAVRAAELASKPRTVDHAHAAATPLSALTAWQALFDHARLTAGQRVLVHGAAGGVGSFAVQLARWRGAHVIATASAGHVDFVRELGADEVVDRGATRFEMVVRDVDVVLDTVGGAVTERSWSVLRPNGLLVTLVRQSPQWTSGRAAKGLFFIVEPRRKQLDEIARLIDGGTIRPRVEAVLPLHRAREAYERGIAQHPRGKLVLAVVDDAPASTRARRARKETRTTDVVGEAPVAEPVDMRLEVVLLGVSDVERAKAFYEKLGWRLDVDLAAGEFRAVHMTPHHSGASILFGKNVTSVEPRSAHGLVLAVDDVDAARDDLLARGVEVSEVFHYAGGPFNDAVKSPRVAGRDPQGRSYHSFVSFEDPDGNLWLLQEIRARLPGREWKSAETDVTTLARLLRETAGHHHGYETTHAAHHWADWYAPYLSARQQGSSPDEAAAAADRHMEESGLAPGE
jgi:NADPH:quinone reductase-like Zn-dependent oxidoreductase/catechol 2,3-dioxygenase-like lactoylglutathione lyase family enzyme